MSYNVKKLLLPEIQSSFQKHLKDKKKKEKNSSREWELFDNDKSFEEWYRHQVAQKFGNVCEKVVVNANPTRNFSTNNTKLNKKGKKKNVPGVDIVVVDVDSNSETIKIVVTQCKVKDTTTNNDSKTNVLKQIDNHIDKLRNEYAEKYPGWSIEIEGALSVFVPNNGCGEKSLIQDTDEIILRNKIYKTSGDKTGELFGIDIRGFWEEAKQAIREIKNEMDVELY